MEKCEKIDESATDSTKAILNKEINGKNKDYGYDINSDFEQVNLCDNEIKNKEFKDAKYHKGEESQANSYSKNKLKD